MIAQGTHECAGIDEFPLNDPAGSMKGVRSQRETLFSESVVRVLRPKRAIWRADGSSDSPLHEPEGTSLE